MAETNTPCGIKFYSWPPGVGYGDVSKDYLLGLAEAGIPVTWTPMVSSTAWAKHGLWFAPYDGAEWEDDPTLTPFCNRDIPYDTVIIVLVPDFFHHIAMLEVGNHVVITTVWETDRIPSVWRSILNSCDQIIVPTTWNRQVFQSSGVTSPIHVIPYLLPECVPTTGDSDVLEKIGIRPNDFVFYTIGTWTTRKDMDATVRAYLAAFTAEDPTVLVIKTTKTDHVRQQRWLNSLQTLLAIGLEVLGLTHLSLRMVEMLKPFRATSQKALQHLLANNDNHPRIILVTDEWPREFIEDLHNRGDCYVSLCHAEGWGLSAFEAAGLGKQVIITGFGGQTEYLPKNLAHLVEFDLIPVPGSSGFSSCPSEHNWGRARIEHAVKLLRDVFDHRELWREKGAQLHDHIHKNFNQAVVTKRLIEVLRRKQS